MPKRGSQARSSPSKVHGSESDNLRDHTSVSPEAIDWPRLAWLAGTSLYIGLFLATRLPSVEAVTGEAWRRWQFAPLLVQPDTLWEAWTGEPGAWGITDRLPILGLATLIIVVAAAAGDLLLRALRVARSLTWAERAFFAATAGLNLVSLWTLAIGLAGGLAERAWWIVPGVGVVLAWIVLWFVETRRARVTSRTDFKTQYNSASDASASSPGSATSHVALLGKPAVAPRRGFATASAQSAGQSSEQLTIWLFVVLAVLLTLPIVLGGMLPPVEFDVREYHLQAPKEFFQRGRVEFLPHNVYGNMPLGVEMHALAAMCVSRDWWFGALVGKTISAAFAPLAALGLFAAGRRLFSSTAGALAALVYLSVPWVVQGATLGLVEAGTGCYLLATLLAASRLSETEKFIAAKSSAEKLPSVSHCAGWTLLAGFLAGGAMATKYPATVFVVLPVGAWVAWTSWRQRHARNAAIAMALYAIAVAAGGGLWLAKNWALAGNPVYPLAFDLFDGTTRTAELNAQWQQAHRPPNFEPADLWRRLAGFVLTSEWLSPLIWPLAALGVLLGWRDGRVKWWLGYVVLFFALWWLLTHRIDRFWVPVLPIVALVAGGAANSITTTPWRRGLLTLVGVGTLWSFVVITSGIGGGDNRYLESLDRLKVDPSRLASWHAYLNTHTPQGQSVLSVGDAQVFDLEVPVLYNTVFDPSVFESIVRDDRGELRPAADIRERLRGVAFVYVNWGEIVRYRSPGNYGFSDFVQPAVFERLVAEGVLAPPVPEFADVPVQIFPVRP